MPSGSIRIAKEADDRFAKPRSNMHRATVTAHHEIAKRERGNQLTQLFGTVGYEGQARKCAPDLSGFLVIAGMLWV